MTRARGVERGTRGGLTGAAAPRAAAVVTGLLLVVLGGCYSYAASDVSHVPVGERVRLTLSADDDSEVARVTGGENPVQELRGDLVGREGGDLLVRVSLAGGPGDRPGGDLGQLVRVQTDDVLAVERRRFSARRTSLLAAGVGVGAVLLYLLSDIDEGGSSPPPPPGPELHLGLFSIPLP